MPTKATVLTWDTENARNLATLAHYGQQDKGGGQYIFHPLAVGKGVHRYAERFRRPDGSFDDYALEVAEQVGYLHDVLEDTAFTYDMLLQLGVPLGVVQRVDVLTHRDGETNEQYMRRVVAEGDFIVHVVKHSDLDHNTNESRLGRLDEKTQERLVRKYTRSRAILDGAA